MSPPRPRIAPLPADEAGPDAAALLERLGPRRAGMNIFATLVRHPRLLRRWSAFGGVLLDGELPGRDRELVILRTAHRCEAHYEWTQHVRLARAAGIDDETVARVPEGPDADGWEPFEAALLRAADELHDASRIADDTWAVLAERYDERQLIELPMLVGQYHLVAFTLNSLGVEPEDGEGAA